MLIVFNKKLSDTVFKPIAERAPSAAHPQTVLEKS